MQDNRAKSDRESPLDVDMWTPNVNNHAASFLRQQAEASKGKVKPYTLLKRRLELARDNINPALIPAMTKRCGLSTCDSLLYPEGVPNEYHFRRIEHRQVWVSE